jgi:hypothetical protein
MMVYYSQYVENTQLKETVQEIKIGLRHIGDQCKTKFGAGVQKR